MSAILAITAPIFILIGLGYIALRYEVVSRKQTIGMGRFVITFALPALLLKAVLEKDLDEVLDFQYLLAYWAASVIAFGIGQQLFRRLRGDTFSGSAIGGMGMAVSNSGFIGYPIAVMAAGDKAAIAMALCMMIENLFMIPLALFLAELGQQQDGQSRWQSLQGTFRNLLRNPMLIAISLGLMLSILQLHPPQAIMNAIDMLAKAAAPVALFVIGASLSGLRIGGFYQEMGLTALGKLILHPCLVMIGFALFPGLDPQLRIAGILIACAPMMSIYPLLGERYGFEGRCAATLITTTTLSFFTVSTFIWILS